MQYNTCSLLLFGTPGYRFSTNGNACDAPAPSAIMAIATMFIAKIPLMYFRCLKLK